jgi:Helix-turn-helix domain
MEQNSQLESIRKSLEAGETITPIDALRRWGCFRLGARIDDLRHEGYNIETLMEKNTTGRGKHARYKLLPKLQPGQLFSVPEPVKELDPARFAR